MRKNQSTLFMPDNDHILKMIGEIADEHSVEVYTVGGYVRDKLLGKKSNATHRCRRSWSG